MHGGVTNRPVAHSGHGILESEEAYWFSGPASYPGWIFFYSSLTAGYPVSQRVSKSTRSFLLQNTVEGFVLRQPHPPLIFYFCFY